MKNTGKKQLETISGVFLGRKVEASMIVELMLYNLDPRYMDNHLMVDKILHYSRKCPKWKNGLVT